MTGISPTASPPVSSTTRWRPTPVISTPGPRWGRKRSWPSAAASTARSYSANAVDFYLDHPLPNGDAVTAQANFVRYDGGGEYPFQSVAKQNTWLLEGAYYLHRARFGPYIQFASRDLTEAGARDDGKVQGGISWWVQKHRVNLKAGSGRLFSDDAADRSQFLVQAQFFYF